MRDSGGCCGAGVWARAFGYSEDVGVGVWGVSVWGQPVPCGEVGGGERLESRQRNVPEEGAESADSGRMTGRGGAGAVSGAVSGAAEGMTEDGVSVARPGEALGGGGEAGLSFGCGRSAIARLQKVGAVGQGRFGVARGRKAGLV